MSTFWIITLAAVATLVCVALYRGWMSTNKGQLKQDAKEMIDKI